MNGPTRAPESPNVVYRQTPQKPHARPIRVAPVFGEIVEPGDAEGRRGPTRTHSSSVLAFPKTADYACSLEVHRRRLGLEGRIAVAALVCGLLGAAVLTWGFPAPPPSGCATDTECRCAVDCLEPAR